MPTDATAGPLPTPPPPIKLVRIVVPRHAALVRINHWINAISLFLLLMSGLQIFNAHPALYWGQKSTFASPWLSMTGEADKAGGLRGYTQVGPLKVETTGVLGVSKFNGVDEARGFPQWVTIPADRKLTVARRWHFFFAWFFGLNGLVYLLSSIFGGHLKRDLAMTGKDVKNLPKDFVEHATLRFHKGWAATRYGPLQKLAYVTTAFIALPLIVLTGMTMSPGLNAAFPLLLDIFGGRQSARSIHFLCAMFIIAFIIVHLVMVLLTGPINQVRAMITGKFAITVDERDKEAPQ
ncbi:cytochrome b/b6 domain-containing protein [soil metagenome]